jgi:hypothetical protein
MRTICATISTLILFSVLGVSFRTSEERVLAQSEKASLIGGQDYFNYMNSCCATSSDCTLPTSTLCSQYGIAQCRQNDEGDYYYTPNNQTICSGVQNNQICASSVNNATCVVNYSCGLDPVTGNCTEFGNPDPYAAAAESCSPNCPQSGGSSPGGGD